MMTEAEEGLGRRGRKPAEQHVARGVALASPRVPETP